MLLELVDSVICKLAGEEVLSPFVDPLPFTVNPIPYIVIVPVPDAGAVHGTVNEN